MCQWCGAILPIVQTTLLVVFVLVDSLYLCFLQKVYSLNRAALIPSIMSVDSSSFDDVAIALFLYQYRHNAVYRTWVDGVNVDPNQVQVIDDIPFIPISSYKVHDVTSRRDDVSQVFTSSGTSGSVPSRHLVYDIDHYLQVATDIFESFYGKVEDFCFLALLPSYLERSGSSLIAMVEHFVQKSQYDESGFYLYDHDRLFEALSDCKRRGIPTVLFGVSFALLDFIENHSLKFPELLVMETGGMKGRKKEMSKAQLQELIAAGFGVTSVHSEYGMTELFSQAYSQRDGIFVPGHTMKVLTREITDPFCNAAEGKTGVINIIDLANIDSCAFIETQDLGCLYADGSFEIMGRLDQSDIRGCNLMVSDL